MPRSLCYAGSVGWVGWTGWVPGWVGWAQLACAMPYMPYMPGVVDVRHEGLPGPHRRQLSTVRIIKERCSRAAVDGWLDAKSLSPQLQAGLGGGVQVPPGPYLRGPLPKACRPQLASPRTDALVSEWTPRRPPLALPFVTPRAGPRSILGVLSLLLRAGLHHAVRMTPSIHPLLLGAPRSPRCS